MEKFKEMSRLDVELTLVLDRETGLASVKDYPGWSLRQWFFLPGCIDGQGEGIHDGKKLSGELTFPDGHSEILNMDEVGRAISMIEMVPKRDLTGVTSVRVTMTMESVG